MVKGNRRSRGWIYVINNYTDDDIAYAMSLYEEDSNCKYNIIAFEKGDREGQPHMQCYIYYTNEVSWRQMFQRLHPNHFEPQCASNAAAYTYSMKPYVDDVYEQGNRPIQGQRTDLQAIRFDIERKVPLEHISKIYLSQWVQYRHAFTEYKRMHVKYDTELVIYDPERPCHILEICAKTDLDTLIIKSQFEFSVTEILFKYYSRQYKVIYYPMHGELSPLIDRLFTHKME